MILWNFIFYKDQREREETRQVCEEYIQKSDMVMAVNESLAEKARLLNKSVFVVKNASDFELMSKAVHVTSELPKDIRELSKPIFGYIGWITANRIDEDLVRFMAGRHPDWTIVLMGPSNPWFVKNISEIQNIKFLPLIDYQELPYSMAGFDVCIIPHHVNAHTKGCNPLKLYDYLDSGRPVLSSAVAGLETFTTDVVYVANTKEEFVQLGERALAERTKESLQQRQRCAQAHSWAIRNEEVWQILLQLHPMSN